MFQLMNKDKLIATFEISTVTGLDTNVETYDKLPLGCINHSILLWIKDRFAARGRWYLSGYLNSINADSTADFLRLTHGVSLNDTYWFKEESDELTWRDVSLYMNEFDTVIQNLAYDGSKLMGYPLKKVTPEFGMGGSYEKCFIREDDGIYMYKRGTEGFSNAGWEPYSEVLASQVFEKLMNATHYDLIVHRGKTSTRSKLFTNEGIGLLPNAIVNPVTATLQELLKYYDSIGSLEQFQRMLVCDAITFNTDRHNYNYGVLVNNDTQEILGMSPCYDYNLALFPMEVDDAFADVNSFIDTYKPKIGNTFIDTARSVLTPAIRSDLLNLKGFKYEFDGETKFTKDRVDWLTQLSNQQINHILGTEDVYMYTSPNKNCVSNIYKYRLANHMNEDQFQQDVPRLMKLFGISHMSELEERVVELL